jgi:hypothetical protein
MADVYQVVSPGDPEAVILAESFDLLRSIVGDYMYRVSGGKETQKAILDSAETHALSYIRVHEACIPPPDPSSLGERSQLRWQRSIA